MNRPENVKFILKDIKSNILDNYVYFLENRINKAIEYIKSNDLLNERNFMETGTELLFKKILEILGDKENE